ncbi:Hypothetical predicted protein, partial [Paramuricea clavata]
MDEDLAVSENPKCVKANMEVDVNECDKSKKTEETVISLTLDIENDPLPDCDIGADQPGESERCDDNSQRYHVDDVLDIVDGSDREFSELSSDDELDDESSYPDRSNGNTQSESGSDDFNLSDDEPLASLANQQDAAVESGYKFNNRRAFIPPSDLEFVDVAAEPEPIDNTPYGYFKSFVTDDMFEHIALESNKKKKPKKWGFKLWARCSSTGFMHKFDIYQGKGTGRDDDVSDCGLGGNVVLKLCASHPPNQNFKVFADNYVSNFALVSALAQRGLHYVGTIANHCLHGAPLKSEKELKKEGRGSYHCAVETSKNLSLVRWLDNKCVTVVSYLAAEPVGSVQRYDRSQKKHISVDRPHVIGVYNI